MMLDINIARMREGFIRYLPVGIFVAIVLLVEMVLVVGASIFDASPGPVPTPEGYDNTEALGSVLYTDYVYPFEIAAVILLVAIIAAIALTLRKRPETRYQNPAQQVRVKREDRVRLVKMEGERS